MVPVLHRFRLAHYLPCFVLPYQREAGQWYAPDLVFTHTLAPEPVSLGAPKTFPLKGVIRDAAIAQKL